MFGLGSRSRKNRSRASLGVAGAVALLAFAASAQAAPYLYATSAGVSQFNIGAGGLLAPLSPPSVGPAAGPTGLGVNPDGKSVYVTNNSDDTVLQYDVNADGTLSPKSPSAIGGVTGPEGLAVSPNGKQVYVANASTERVEPNITVYNVLSDGALSLRGSVKSGQTPHAVAVSPDGTSLYVSQCCQAHGVAQFTISNGGLVQKVPGWAPISGLEAGGIAVGPNGNNVYVTNYIGTTIYQFTVGA